MLDLQAVAWFEFRRPAGSDFFPLCTFIGCRGSINSREDNSSSCRLLRCERNYGHSNVNLLWSRTRCELQGCFWISKRVVGHGRVFLIFDRPCRYIKAGFLCNRLPKYNPDSKIHNVTEKKTDKKLSKIRKGKRH